MTVGELLVVLARYPQDWLVRIGYESIAREVDSVGPATGWRIEDADRSVMIEANEFTAP